MKKPHILIILGSPEGGIGTHITSILKNLHNNFKFSFAASFDKADKTFSKEMKKYESDLNDIFDIRIEKKPSILDIKNIFTLYNRYKTMEIDIIHGHGAKGGLYARALGKMIGAKVIYTPHGGSLHQMHGKVMNRFYITIESILFHFTDIVIFESNYTKNIFIDKIGSNHQEKMIVNYNGVLPEECPKEYQERKRTILAAFGILRHLKGHDLLIRSVRQLVDRNQDIELRIYGEGEEKENLIALISSLKLDNHVKLPGHVKNVKEHILNANIVVHPSRFEALPYVPIEAMNLCRPVIVSNVGGLEEIIEDKVNGLVFQNENVEELTEKIEYILQNREKTLLMIENAKKRVSTKFNEKVMLKTLSKVYMEVGNTS